MKFPFISIEPLIDQLKSELKSMHQQGNISTDDCYMWAVDVAREIAIGEDGLDNETVFIKLNNGVGHLPKDFYVAKEIWACEHPDLKYSPNVNVLGNSFQYINWKRTCVLRPGDSTTMRFCSKDFVDPKVSPSDRSYLIRVPPGTIRTSYKCGVIQLTYYRLTIDKENNQILVPDEIHTKKAIVNYMKYKIFEEKFLMQEIPATIYQSIKQDYEDELTAAKQIMKFDNPQDSVYQALAQANRYRRFRI